CELLKTSTVECESPGSFGASTRADGTTPEMLRALLATAVRRPGCGPCVGTARGADMHGGWPRAPPGERRRPRRSGQRIFALPRWVAAVDFDVLSELRAGAQKGKHVDWGASPRTVTAERDPMRDGLIIEVARQQHGLVSRPQALRAGLSTGAVGHRLRNG